MNKKGLFYGSSSGNTKNIAGLIAKGMGLDNNDCSDIAHATPELLLNYDVLILGSSTWGLGDLQDDWEGFISKFAKLDLTGKKVAVFGTGDSSSYSDTFCDAIGIIAETAQQAGAKLIGGGINTSGYSFDSSKAVKNGTFCGLALDEDNESDKTAERIKNWIAQLQQECA